MEALKPTVESSHQVESVTLVPSRGGVFDVTVDGRIVFSKKALGRHAAPGEVVQRIQDNQA